jgi:hypothetical protein
MLTAVKFDDETGGDADKIRDVRADWNLSAKFGARQPLRLDSLPKPPFLRRLVAT